MYPHTDFPPSFEGNPWAYGFALFGTVLISAMCLMFLLAYVFEGRRHRAVLRMVGSLVPPKKQSWFSALTVYQGILVNLMFAIFLRGSSDALVLLAWGEVSQGTMQVIFIVNYLANGVAVIPFIFALLLWSWASQTIPQRLAEEALVPMPPITWQVMKDKVKITGLVFLLALGVTIGKANA